MSLTVAILEKMQEKGLTLADAIELGRMWEEAAKPAAPTANAIRQRRHRAKLAAQGVTSNVTHNASDNGSNNVTPPKDVSPTPPSEITPIPPLKGGTSPTETPPEKPNQTPAKALSSWVAEIWELTPRPGRERSGRRDLENALRAALRRGGDPAAIREGVSGYYASPDATKDQGQFAKGVHVVISSGRWEAFAESVERSSPEEPEDPWARRLLRWRIATYWDREWGPKPGEPGYQGPAVEARRDAA